MASIIIVIIIGIVNISLWVYFYVKFKKTFSPDGILTNISREVDKLLIEIRSEERRVGKEC